MKLFKDGLSIGKATTCIALFASLCFMLDCCTKQPSYTGSVTRDEAAVLSFESLSLSFQRYSFGKKTEVELRKSGAPGTRIAEGIIPFGDEYFVTFNSELQKEVLIRISFDESKIPAPGQKSNIILFARTKSGFSEISPSIVDTYNNSVTAKAKSFDSILLCAAKERVNYTVSAKSTSYSELPDPLADELRGRGINDKAFKAGLAIRSAFQSEQSFKELLAGSLNQKPPFIIGKADIISILPDFRLTSTTRSSKAGEAFNCTVTIASPAIYPKSGESAMQAVASTRVTYEPGEKSTQSDDALATWMAARENDHIAASFDGLLDAIGPSLAAGDEIFAFGYAKPDTGALENGALFYGSGKNGQKELARIVFRTSIVEEKSEPKAQKGVKIDLGKTDDTETLEKLNEAMLLSESDFPRKMKVVSAGFLREHPFKAPSPLSRIDFLSYGYRGTTIHGFENASFDEKASDKYQLLTFMYFPLMFKDADSARAVLNRIRTEIQDRKLAESFTSEATIGIKLDVERRSIRAGDESHSFLMHGKLDREGVKQEFNTNIIFFRIGPVLTVVNSLSIGPYSEKSMTEIIGVLESKIRHALR